MKRSITEGLVLISILLIFSLGITFAEVSKDKANATTPKNITNISKNTNNTQTFRNPIEIRPINTTKNLTDATSINITNETMPLNATKNVTNNFTEIREISKH